MLLRCEISWSSSRDFNKIDFSVQLTNMEDLGLFPAVMNGHSSCHWQSNQGSKGKSLLLLEVKKMLVSVCNSNW